MGILDLIKTILGLKTSGIKVQEKGTIYKGQKATEIHSIWDFLQFNEHTQAYHLTSVIKFDEWISMDEIRRRIFDLFQVNYENERSLYPYLKTMVDLGLIEMNNIGGKRKWRKKELIIKLEAKKEEETEKEEEKETISVENS